MADWRWTLLSRYRIQDTAGGCTTPTVSADLTNGGYVDNSMHAGVAVKYSYKNWNPRWIVEGEGSGWMMDIWDPPMLVLLLLQR